MEGEGEDHVREGEQEHAEGGGDVGEEGARLEGDGAGDGQEDDHDLGDSDGGGLDEAGGDGGDDLDGEGDGEGEQGIELELKDAMPEEEEEGVRGGSAGEGGDEASKERADDGTDGASRGRDDKNDAKGDKGTDLEPGDPLLKPPHGTEVFVGGVGADVTEVDLRAFFEGTGEIFEVRTMKDRESGTNKPYAFVTFTSKEDAEKAISQLHDTKLKGKSVRVTQSQARNRLFIGNVPKAWSKDELQTALEAEGKGITTLELLMDPKIPNRNRGFAFVEYYNHGCAEVARRNMTKSHFRLAGNAPTVSWADPRAEPDAATLATVKVVYVKGLTEKVVEDDLKEVFSQFGEVTRVVLPAPRPGQPRRDFGFVHFAERACALKAIEQSEKVEVDGKAVEISLAKPPDKRPAPGTDDQYGRGRQGLAGSAAGAAAGSGLLPHYRAYGGYGDGGGGYGRDPGYGGYSRGGSGGSGYFAAGQHPAPIIYGRGPPPSGMVMVPMMLPDGRVGYVFQRESERGPQSSHGSRSTGGGSSSRSQYGASGGQTRSSLGYGDTRSKGSSRYQPY